VMHEKCFEIPFLEGRARPASAASGG
jgi:hypothetical protein